MQLKNTEVYQKNTIKFLEKNFIKTLNNIICLTQIIIGKDYIKKL